MGHRERNFNEENMRTFILTLVFLFSCSLCFGAIVDVGGYYSPVTKTYSVPGTASGTIVWTPALGKKIVLMGLIAGTKTQDVKSNTSIEFGTDYNVVTSSGTPIIPPICVASGITVISSASPIWESAADGTIYMTVRDGSITPSITLWGYEK